MITSGWLLLLLSFNPPLKIFVGGGLISGVALAAKSINPAIRVLAAEPRGANDAAQSKNAGRIITLPETNTIADGLRASLGDLTWYRLPINNNYKKKKTETLQTSASS